MTTTTESLRNIEKEKLSSLLNLGYNCAKLMKASCVSEQLSKSYSEESLRFTCQNGHNFFLSVRKLEDTYSRLKKRNLTELSDTEVNSLTWCNKCTKFYSKVKTLSTRLQLNLFGGLFRKRILLQCKQSSHHFSITYSKKLE